MKNQTVMTKRTYYILGVICIIAAGAMYFLGKEDPKLTELKDFWWIPLPIAALFLLLANRK
jgi:hypothetical protein